MSEFPLRNDLLYYGKLAQRQLGYVAGQIELTSACGQKCKFCSSWIDHRTGKQKGTLELETVTDLLNQFNRMPTFEHVAFTGGDPQHWETKLEVLFDWIAAQRKLGDIQYGTQVNTAMILPIEKQDQRFWHSAVDDLRVSLDGVDKEHYFYMRRVETDPEEILNRLEDLQHPGLSFNTTVGENNIDHVLEIVRRVASLQTPVRKMMFLPVLGFFHQPEFWEKWGFFYKMDWSGLPFKVSFASDEIPPLEAGVRCHAGSISFHVKANGDVYPCCLVGGEALKTIQDLSLGNVYHEDMETMRKRYVPLSHYDNPDLPCSMICQFKQASINHAAERASRVNLAMP